jgi:hypothetical protein
VHNRSHPKEHIRHPSQSQRQRSSQAVERDTTNTDVVPRKKRFICDHCFPDVGFKVDNKHGNGLELSGRDTIEVEVNDDKPELAERDTTKVSPREKPFKCDN